MSLRTTNARKVAGRRHLAGRFTIFSLLLFACVGSCLCGCKPKGPPATQPTPEQVKTGIAQTKERVRNNPNLTPQQKEQALRLLEGMEAAAQQAPPNQDE